MFTYEKVTEKTYYKAIVVSSDIYLESLKTLENLGIKVLFTFENIAVSPFLSKHADMQLVSLNSGSYICSPECYDYYLKIFEKFNKNLISGNTYLSSNYPEDIAYNIAIGEKYAVHNFKYTDSILKESLQTKLKINVSQGYSGCSICVLPNDCYITSDEGILKEISRYNVSYLQIDSGNVDLNGYEHGFFGGASFMIGPKTLAINGDIRFHPDYASILNFCNNHQIEVLSLSPNKIMDIGSAVYID